MPLNHPRAQHVMLQGQSLPYQDASCQPPSLHQSHPLSPHMIVVSILCASMLLRRTIAIHVYGFMLLIDAV